MGVSIHTSSLRAEFPLLVPQYPGRDSVMASDRIGEGPGHGAWSRLPGTYGLTSRTTRRCASHESHLSSTLRPRPRSAPRADHLLADGARVANSDGARTQTRQGLVSPEIMISHALPNRRAVPGHWRPHLGLGSSAIGTLAERTTRFTVLLHLPRLTGRGDAPRA